MSIRDKSLLRKKKSSRLTQIEVEQSVSSCINRIKFAFSKSKLDQISWETGFIKRASSRFLGRDFLIALLISSLDTAHCSLEKISSILTKVNKDIRITAQSIMERINSPEAVNFCLRAQETILSERISKFTKTIPPVLFSYFSEVFIQDSTVLELK